MGTDGEILRIALIGNPNSGKTSVFNRLTGLNQKVGNFPGITVDKKTGNYKLPNGQKAVITDLPGTYSLYPNSTDERMVIEVLLNRDDPSFPDLVLYVADADNLERNLVLLTQIMDLGFPVILLLNMVDVAQSAGKSCNEIQLANQLQIPVIKVNGRTGEGISDIGETIVRMEKTVPQPFIDARKYGSDVVSEIEQAFSLKNDYRALLVAHNYKQLHFIKGRDAEIIDNILARYDFKSIGLQFDELMERYDKLHPIMEAMTVNPDEDDRSPTARADRVLTHPVWGSVIFALTLFLIFQAIFAWASYPMEWIDEGMTALTASVKELLPPGLLNDFLTDGLMAGIGGILIFVPQITILFILVSLLEEVGYMSRAVFLSDTLMQRFGLNGRSIVSLLSGAACAVPAIMSARTIRNQRERLATIFVTPFISCSARIPVYTVLVAFAVPDKSVFGLFNLQGLVMMGLYTLGVVAALGTAWVMKKLYKTGEPSMLMLELPSYKMPYWKNIGITVVEKVKLFVFNAGKIILVVSMILWVLASFGPGNKMEQAEELARKEYAGSGMNAVELEDLVAARRIEASYAGHLGKVIEPVIKPLGYDWKIGIALITSFAAREVFVSTMATIYSVGSSGDNRQTIVETMRNERNPETGELVYSVATSFSLLIFYVLAMQCMSTLAIVKRETKSWAVPVAQLFYMTALAWLLSFITYQILS